MRKTIISFVIIAALAATTAMAQHVYQLPNGGFEEWDSPSGEPAHWNSFGTCDGSYASLASTTHHAMRNGGRPGSSGSRYLTIWTRSIVGIKANGNMTTGRIHAGAMSASSENNYNYTQRSQSDFSQPFHGTPDSMYVWVSYYASSTSSKAQITAFIHGDVDFRAPNDENNASLYCGKITAQFDRTTTQNNSMQWQQLKLPVVYDGTSEARYLLINLTTNAVPGGGDANDSLSVDDIEFIYSAWLRGITIGGNPIATFAQDRYNYSIHLDDTAALDTVSISAICQANDATVAINRTRTSDSTAQADITVTAEDGVTTKHYTLLLTSSIHTDTDPLEIDPAKATTLRCYPNPAGNTLRVESRPGRIVLVDMMGHTVLTQATDGATTLDLTPYPAGLYRLVIDGSTHNIVITK